MKSAKFTHSLIEMHKSQEFKPSDLAIKERIADNPNKIWKWLKLDLLHLYFIHIWGTFEIGLNGKTTPVLFFLSAAQAAERKMTVKRLCSARHWSSFRLGLIIFALPQLDKGGASSTPRLSRVCSDDPCAFPPAHQMASVGGKAWSTFAPGQVISHWNTSIRIRIIKAKTRLTMETEKWNLREEAAVGSIWLST